MTLLLYNGSTEDDPPHPIFGTYRHNMWKQVQIVLTLLAVTPAFGNFHSKKNTFKQQEPQQYASVATFHSSAPQQQSALEPQAIPSPYSFNYEADGSARQETADGNGKVSGRYTVTNADGSVRVVNYIADEQGFRADVDTNEAGTKTSNPANAAFKSTFVEPPEPVRFEEPEPQSYAVDMSYSNQQTEQKHIQSNLDGSSNSADSFKYDAQHDDSSTNSRSEISDGNAEATGHYSMPATDGRQRLADNTFGNERFQAEIDASEFVKSNDDPAPSQFYSSAPAQFMMVKTASASAFQPKRQASGFAAKPIQQQSIQTSSFASKPIQQQPLQEQRIQQQPIQQKPIQQQRIQQQSVQNHGFSANQQQSTGYSTAHVRQQQAQAHGFTAPFNQQQIQSYDSKPSPYSFNYNAQLDDGSSSRSESSDANGKVVGSYSLTDADGRKRTINYETDHLGFRAKVNTNEFGTKSDSPANVQFYSNAPQIAPSRPERLMQKNVPADFSLKQAPVMASSQIKSAVQPQKFSAGQIKPAFHSQKASTSSASQIKSTSQASAASHNQAFRSQKSAAPSQMKSAFLAPQTASSTSQFKSAYQGTAASPSQIKSAFKTQQISDSSTSQFKSSYQASQSNVQYAPQIQQYFPYAFNYAADLEDGSISRQESADESGKVIGSYSFAVEDGRKRTVDYFADQGGFRATINTNEFGTKSDSPANVELYSSAVLEEPIAPAVYSQAPIVHQFQSTAKVYNRAPTAPQLKSNKESYNRVPEAHRFQSNEEAYNRAPAAPQFQSNEEAYNRAPAAPQFQSNEEAYNRAEVTPQLQSNTASSNSYQSSESAEFFKQSSVAQQQVEPEMIYQPSPYSFNYEADGSARSESSDSNGQVIGSYTVQNEDGSVRVVDYVADKDGFRANVKTDEPGTKSDDPANVVFKSSFVPAPVVQQQQQSLKASRPSAVKQFSQKPAMISQKSIDHWSR